MDRQPLPKAELIPRSMTGPICCPYQTSLAHIPFLVYDIKDDGRCHIRYMDVQRRRLSRVVAIACVRYCGQPVTPRRNRSNPLPLNEVGTKQQEHNKGGDSYHRIRLVNTLAAEDIGRMVELLIDDHSQYCVGFRRGVMVGENERWSTWYRCRGDFTWPSFLPCEVLSIKGDHEINVDIGGYDTLTDILRGLWRYPRNMDDKVTLRRAFLRAVVVFCEALRLLSILLEVFRRIQSRADASALTPLMWRRIRNWSASCEFVLTAAGKDHGNIDADMFWERYNGILGYESFNDLVAELSVFKWHLSLLDYYKGENKQWLKRKQPGTEVANPGFPPPAQDAL